MKPEEYFNGKRLSGVMKQVSHIIFIYYEDVLEEKLQFKKIKTRCPENIMKLDILAISKLDVRTVAKCKWQKQNYSLH